MAAQLVTIDNAVVTLINGHAFSFPRTFTAKRVYVPSLEVSQLEDGQVYVLVAPLKRGLSNRDRSSVQVDLVITIGVEQKVDRDDLVTLDALMLLVEDMVEYLQVTPPVTDPTFQRVIVENEPAFDAKFLEEHGVFFSLIRASYQAQK